MSRLMERLQDEKRKLRDLWAASATATQAAAGFAHDGANCACDLCSQIRYLQSLENGTSVPEFLPDLERAIEAAQRSTHRVWMESSRLSPDVATATQILVRSPQEAALAILLMRHAEELVRHLRWACEAFDREKQWMVYRP